MTNRKVYASHWQQLQEDSPCCGGSGPGIGGIYVVVKKKKKKTLKYHICQVDLHGLQPSGFVPSRLSAGECLRIQI